jgi:pimeloyl-ACP methyl ester carboxylesterase
MGTDWTFGGTWPYEPRFFATADGRLHHVDEGPRDGTAVVLLHGNPTWSYLYRRIVPPLVEAGCRAIAVDHLGFGRSDKPAGAAPYAVAAHARRLAALLDGLGLRDAVVVVHDWSGPIALPWVAAHPDRVAGLVVLNTFAPRLPGPMGAMASVRALRAPLLGPLLVKRRSVPVEAFLLRAGLARPERLDDRAREAYRAPHPTPADRDAVLAFPRQIPLRRGGPVAELAARTADRLPRALAGKPVTLCWGARDVLFGEDVLSLWRELLPAATVARLPDAGHFLQEDAPEAVAEHVVACARAAARRPNDR